MRQALLTAATAAALILASAAPALGATPSVAGTPAEQQLAARYAPIVMLRKQDPPPCDTGGEQYAPTSVDTVLGNPGVTLQRRIKGRPTRAVKRAPTAADIAGLGDEYYLNLPGDTLEPGCRYAKDFRALVRAHRAPAIAYANVVREPGHSGLVVQYWFFYYYNQFNDLHEGDWEGMQITFTANTPEQALTQAPDQVALFQHGSGEVADWDDGRVKTEGDHPVVYPAAGSHATFFDSAIYVGNGSGSSGLGCDNTSAPLHRVPLRAVLVPTYPRIGAPYQWLTYLGRWGQHESGFNNGPTGPITKQQWYAPFSWMENKRSASPKLPGGALLGTAISSVFCGAVASASELVNLEAKSRGGAFILVGGTLLFLFLLVAATTWRPTDIDHLRIHRRFGQLVRAARQLYGRHWRSMVLLGLTALPIMAAIAGLEWASTQLFGSQQVDQSTTGVQLDLSGIIGGIGRPVGLAVASAFVISYVRLLDLGTPSLHVAYRTTLRRFWRVVGAQLLGNLMLLLLVLTIIGIPIAIWKYFGWQLVQQKILFEDAGLRQAFRGSSRLVRGHWWHVVRVTLFLEIITAVAGPLLLMALVFTTLELFWINLLGSVVFALLIPYVSTTKTLLYFDLEVAAEAPATESRRGWRRWGRRRSPAVPATN